MNESLLSGSLKGCVFAKEKGVCVLNNLSLFSKARSRPQSPFLDPLSVIRHNDEQKHTHQHTHPSRSLLRLALQASPP